MVDILQRVEQWGHLAPDRLAHVSGDRQLTYGELAFRSDRLASYLAHALPEDHSPVVVQGHKEPEMLVGFLGAVKAGHAYIPVDRTTPAQRTERIVAISGARIVLTPEHIRAIVADPSPRSNHARPVGQQDPYYIIFTSGSTGEPKGVVITKDCLESFLDWTLSEQGFEQSMVGCGETFLNQAPFSFDLSVMDLYSSLAVGGTLFSIQQDEIASPAQLYRALGRSEVTVWVSTPSFARMCLAERSFNFTLLPLLHKFWFCGETLSPELAAELLERFPDSEVWNTYGPTEATVATTSIRVDREILAKYASLPVGFPKPGTRVAVLAEQWVPALPGERGEIVIAGPNVSPGYLGRPDLTARSFFEWEGVRAYHTGDWGRYRDGLLFFEGRQDNQIKLHGHRIELGDVESNLQAVPGVRAAVVIPQMKDGSVDSLAACVILTGPAKDPLFQTRTELRQALARSLPAYMLPRKFLFLTAFPMTPNGKADRRKLAEMIA